MAESGSAAAALLDDESDDNFEEKIAGSLVFLVDEVTKLSREVGQLKGKFDSNGNETPSSSLGRKKIYTIRNINEAISLAKSRGQLTNNTTKENPKRKFDLSTWPYPKIRDMINISTDMELLTECHAEIQRRVTMKKEAEMKSAKFTYNRMPVWGEDPLRQTSNLFGLLYVEYNGDLKVVRQFKITNTDADILSRIAGVPSQAMINSTEVSLKEFELALGYYQRNTV